MYCNIFAVGAVRAFIKVAIFVWEKEKPAFFWFDLMLFDGRSPAIIGFLVCVNVGFHE